MTCLNFKVKILSLLFIVCLVNLAGCLTYHRCNNLGKNKHKTHKAILFSIVVSSQAYHAGDWMDFPNGDIFSLQKVRQTGKSGREIEKQKPSFLFRTSLRCTRET